MKKIFSVFLFTSLLFLSFCAQKETTGRFSFFPEKPVPGEQITVQYNPVGTNLEKAEEIHLVAYSFTSGPPEAKDYILKKKEKTWTASFSIDEKSRGIIIKFTHEKEVDNNQKNGYLIPLYSKRGNPVPGGLAGLAEAYSSWGRYFMEMDSDMELALSYFEEEFKLHPDLKREYLVPYLIVIASIKREEGKEIILKELDELAGMGDLSEEELSMMIDWYTRLNLTEEVQKYSTAIQEQYPRGTFIQEERFREFYGTKDVDKKIALLEKYKSDFPESDFISAMYMYVCFAYRDRGEYIRIKDYLEKNPGEVNWSLYNNIAWSMAEKDIELELAAEFAAKGVELAREERKNPKMVKPSYITEREWEEQAVLGLGMVLDTYGFTLLKIDKPRDALPAIEEAARLSKGQNLEVNERYAETLLKSGSFEKAISEIGKFIKEGYSTARMEDLYKQAYVQHTGDEKEASEQFLKLKKVAQEKIVAELRETMLDSPAPDFTLDDLAGNSISLVNLRGKIVVIDFWATWCGPCRESFPGMKKAVEHYENDESVRFFFINSSEQVDDWKKNASDFMTQNNYPFHVLLDTENKATTAFKVESIPTKFIIDKKGKIRFKSVGFTGNTDKLAEELSLMIEMLR
jgi:thiol-disulfide isomerase/thioredoxin